MDPTASTRLPKVVDYLMPDANEEDELDSWDSLRMMKALLCVRSPNTELPPDILEDIDVILQRERAHKLPIPSSSIPSSNTGGKVKLALWRGDITTLTEVTAVVNAANSQLLGCFQPPHACIDNAIHAAAGPRLRDECMQIMTQQGKEEAVGLAKVTKGYNIPAEYIIHTVGPQLPRGAAPTAEQKSQLGQCYTSCLDAVEKLPALKDGRKVIAFCCISTGLFAFPQHVAAKIAISTIQQWITDHPKTSVTDFILDVFSEDDHDEYAQVMELLGVKISSHQDPIQIPRAISPSSAIGVAASWLREADTLVISAGAGLSASTGLDYTSKKLFRTHLPGYLQYGFRCLYDLFRPVKWPSPQVKWGYYFHHLQMIRNWPKSELYAALLRISKTFDSNVHVRTSNADGLFLANGFEPQTISTPQGQYAVLQCLANCRPDATFPTQPFLDAALPFLEPKSQTLTDASKVPVCKYCGGDVFICVRAGHWFNERPFAEGEKRWKEFRKALLSDRSKKTVILELGVGRSTPGVLHWPNEALARASAGHVKVVQICLDSDACADWDADWGVAIQGDIGGVIKILEESRKKKAVA